MSENHKDGDTEYFMGADKYNGEFQNVVSGINFMLKDYVDNTRTIFNIVQKYADGDFNTKLIPFPDCL